MKYIARLLAIITAFALLFAAYGGRVDPTIWLLPSLATLALPVVAIVAIAVMVLLALFRQWRAVVVIFGALLLSWPTLRLISPFNITTPKANPDAQGHYHECDRVQLGWQRATQQEHALHS